MVSVTVSEVSSFTFNWLWSERIFSWAVALAGVKRSSEAVSKKPDSLMMARRVRSVVGCMVSALFMVQGYAAFSLPDARVYQRVMSAR